MQRLNNSYFLFAALNIVPGSCDTLFRNIGIQLLPFCAHTVSLERFFLVNFAQGFVDRSIFAFRVVSGPALPFVD